MTQTLGDLTDPVWKASYLGSSIRLTFLRAAHFVSASSRWVGWSNPFLDRLVYLTVFLYSSVCGRPRRECLRLGVLLHW